MNTNYLFLSFVAAGIMASESVNAVQLVWLDKDILTYQCNSFVTTSMYILTTDTPLVILLSS